MGILNDIFDASMIGQRLNAVKSRRYNAQTDLEDRKIKNAKLNELVPPPSQNPEIMNKIFNATGNITPEMADSADQESMIPSELNDLNTGQFMDVTGGIKNLARTKALGVDKGEEWDRRFDKQTERMMEMQEQGNKNRQATEDRVSERKAAFVPPKAKDGYKSLRDNIKIANKIKSDFETAISKGYNVTGLLMTPINKLNEIIGTMPKEQQDLLVNLRLNFADFVRERGGTAFTATEREVFGPIMPEEGKDEKTNLNRINRMIDIMTDKETSFLESYPGLQSVGGNRDVVKTEDKVTTSVPKAGEVRKGFLFKGGNPSDPSSWEKVKK